KASRQLRYKSPQWMASRQKKTTEGCRNFPGLELKLSVQQKEVEE
ncbi:uncharacterized, partial [Tachysurus ichikawai]